MTATTNGTTTRSASTVLEIPRIEKATLRFHLLGTSPLILNRMSEKARRELLLPKGRKTAADKATTAKHDPLGEYRASPYTFSDEAAPTLLALMASAFKGAMRTAALDLPGATKAQVGRIIYVEGTLVPVYGVPEIFMAVTRSADINRTPDIRTRAILPEWACAIDVSFVSSLITGQSVLNLLAASGITVGVGDWRPEKGKGDFGQFAVVNEDDPQYRAIIERGDRAAQMAAMETPTAFDDETASLLDWATGEAQRRGLALTA